MENKMTDEMYERLCAYVFGELQGAERAAFEAELAANPALAAERDQLEASAALVREFAPAAPIELSQASRAALLAAAAKPGATSAPQAAPPKPTPWYMHPALQVAAAAGLVIVGFRALENSTRKDRNGSVLVANTERTRELSEGLAYTEQLGYAGAPAETQALGGGSTPSAELSMRSRAQSTWVAGGAKPENTEFEDLAYMSQVPDRKQAPASDVIGLGGGIGYLGKGSSTDRLNVLGYVDGTGVDLRGLGGPGPGVNDSFVDFGESATGSNDWFLGQGSAGASINVVSPKPSLGGGGSYRGPGDSMPSGQAAAAAPATPGSGSPGSGQPEPDFSVARFSAGNALSFFDLNAKPEAPVSAEEVSGQLEDMSGLGLDDGESGQPPSAGFFYDDGKDGDFRGSTSNIFSNPLGATAVELERLKQQPAEYNAIVAEAIQTVLAQTPAPAGDPADVDTSSRTPVVPENASAAQLKEVVQALTPEQQTLVEELVEGKLIDLLAAEEVARIEAQAKAEQERIEATYNHLIQRYTRQPNEKPSMMYFRFWGDNGFEFPSQDRVSTFAADVDTASYTLARKYIQEGYLPERAQIRTEEFVNYFTPDVAAPTDGRVFNITHELAPSLFGPKSATQTQGEVNLDEQRWTLRVGVRGKEISKEERDPLALTFVIDVSGSMDTNNRIELVKHSLRLLVGELHASDQIAIVTFAQDAKRVLTMQPVNNVAAIEKALYGIKTGGGTNAEGGLMKGYEEAVLGYAEGAVNRVVFLSDGVGNIGETNEQKLLAEVKRAREKGIYLNTIGVGMGNHNDRFLEQLANGGDGICNFIDGPEEAERALVTNFTGAMQPIARDVKLQVDFDPDQVLAYRLLGYENRAIADADFRNDKVDAGEIGSGHQVVALYELVLKNVDTTGERPLATTRLRYKKPYGELETGEQDKATEIEVAASWSQASGTFEGASLAFQKSALAAEFAEMLRRSSHAREDSVSLLRLKLEELDRASNDAEVTELAALVQLAQPQLEKVLKAEDPVYQAVEELAQYEYWCGTQVYVQGDDVLEPDTVTARREVLRENLRRALQ